LPPAELAYPAGGNSATSDRFLSGRVAPTKNIVSETKRSPGIFVKKFSLVTLFHASLQKVRLSPASGLFPCHETEEGYNFLAKGSSGIGIPIQKKIFKILGGFRPVDR
jgi:hypothetical protein